MSAEQLPREPSAWSPTPHLGDRVRKPSRFLDGDAIRACIEEGVRHELGNGYVATEQWVDGVHYRLVLDPETREVVTGYPQGVDQEVALASGWTEGQLQEVREAIRREKRRDHQR